MKAILHFETIQEQDTFLREYSRVVRIVIRPFFLNGADYDDLYQEGMIGLWNAVRTFDENRTAAFETYATQCIRNRVIDAIRIYVKANKSSGFSVDFADTLGQTAVSDAHSNPEVLVLANESAKEITSALSGLLSPFEASVLDPYLEGYTALEIASAIGRSAKSVDNAIGRIRRKLAHHFLKGDIRTIPVRINPSSLKGVKER